MNSSLSKTVSTHTGDEASLESEILSKRTTSIRVCVSVDDNKATIVVLQQTNRVNIFKHKINHYFSHVFFTMEKFPLNIKQEF